MKKRKHIAIIGAGPCGLMAAEALAAKGYQVAIYDRMASPARKFLIAGRGGLNLTHSEALDSFIRRYGEAAEWLAPVIEAFPPAALRAWCEGLGEETFVGSSGRVFPRSMKAVSLLRAWLKRLEGLGVQYHPRHSWQGWEGEALCFVDAAQEKVQVTPDATLLALGGASWPRLGSDGAWLEMLRDAGVEVTSLRPSNCGFVVPWSSHFSERFAGVPLKPVAVTHGGESRQGEAMVTAQGIEGGVIYALSAGIREAIAAKGKTVLHLDMRPGMTQAALAQKLEKRNPHKSLGTSLRGMGFAPVIISLLREVMSAEALGRLDARQMAAVLKALPITVTETASMARAISSAGGIKREAVTQDFMLRARPGVFAAGEMLDWEAPTGGYLLQGCFSTAVAAAQGIQRYCEA